MAYSASTKRRWPPPRSWLMTRRLRRPKAYWRRSTPRSTEVGPCHESAVQAQPPCCAPVRGANNASCLQLLLHAVGHARERCPGAWRGGQRGQVAPPSTCGWRSCKCGHMPCSAGVCAPRPRVQRCIILDKILGQCETSHSGRPEPGGGSQKAVPPRTDVLNTRVCVSKVWQKSQNSGGANRRPQC